MNFKLFPKKKKKNDSLRKIMQKVYINNMVVKIKIGITCDGLSNFRNS